MLPNFPLHSKSFAPQCTVRHKKRSKWLLQPRQKDSATGKTAAILLSGKPSFFTIFAIVGFELVVFEETSEMEKNSHFYLEILLLHFVQKNYHYEIESKCEK